MPEYLEAWRAEIEAALERVIASSAAPPAVAEAIRYSLVAPGKRLRPILTLAAAEAVGRTQGVPAQDAHALAMPAACAVEMIHSYSLVHDDLPAMDNDDWRRGRKTTHVVYGDGIAILAGDGLLTDAFSVLAGDAQTATPAGVPIASPDRRLRALGILARAAGSSGMVGGQAIDLAAVGDGATFDASSLEDMHLRKTGALIRAAATMGAVLAGGGDAAIAAIDTYAKELGLAFQIIDDILDVEGSNDALGKTVGKDAAAGKPTFPALHGLAHSKDLAAACIARAHAALAAHGLQGRLDEIADWSLDRKK
ncbi:MAG: polyprenyl synthetase family protein [Acidobacteriota bacterium]